MNHAANTKRVLAVNQASTTNGATASGNIDTLGFDYASIDVLLTTSNNTTNNPSVLKVSESDDTVATNFSDITELVGDGTGGFTIPAAITAATSVVGPAATINVDLRGRKRYLKVSVSPVTTQSVTVLAQLSKGEQAINSAADANADVLVEA